MSKTTAPLAALVATAALGCAGETTTKAESPRFGGTIKRHAH